ncbi:MAG: hypothetical protein IVW56_09440 [Candidatus Binataceae bacterium]|nr:hypothetical protein [Candidatus Binataceae bacterium]
MRSFNHAFSLGAGTGTFPTAVEALLVAGASGTVLTVVTAGGETVALGAVPPGLYVGPRIVAVTANTGFTITGWWS